MTSAKLKLLPISYQEFGSTPREYLKYLEDNQQNHHYGPFQSIQEWFEYQLSI